MSQHHQTVFLPLLVLAVFAGCASEPVWPNDNAERPGPMALVGYDTSYPRCDLVLRKADSEAGARIRLGDGIGYVLVGAAAGTYLLEGVDCGSGIKIKLSEGDEAPVPVTISGDGIHYLGNYSVHTHAADSRHNHITIRYTAVDAALRQLQRATEKLGSKAERLVSGYTGKPLRSLIGGQGLPSRINTSFVYAPGSKDVQLHQSIHAAVDRCYKTEQQTNPLLLGRAKLHATFRSGGEPVFEEKENDSNIRPEFFACVKDAFKNTGGAFRGKADVVLKPE